MLRLTTPRAPPLQPVPTPGARPPKRSFGRGLTGCWEGGRHEHLLSTHFLTHPAHLRSDDAKDPAVRSSPLPPAAPDPPLPLLVLDSPAGPAEAERGGCCPLLLPEEAEELLEPLFLSMSEAVVAAAFGELCGINGGLGGGDGGRSGAGAAGTQAHGVQGRRGSAAAAVLGLHGDIFPCFLP